MDYQEKSGKNEKHLFNALNRITFSSTTMGQSFPKEQIKEGVWSEDIANHPAMSFEFEHEGYQCEIIRNSASWTYCGYVHLPSTHPDYDKMYYEVEEIIIHGGLTYSNTEGIFGFDCHHLDDLSPADPNIVDFLDRVSGEVPEHPAHYWTFEEAEAEVKRLAEQFKTREKIDLELAKTQMLSVGNE